MVERTRGPWVTGRLVVSALTPDDAAGLYAALSHPEVATYIGGPDVESLEWLERRIDQVLRGPGPDRSGERWLNFVVRCDGEICGRLEATVHSDAGEQSRAHSWAEVAWVFGPRWWGRGLGGEAATWLAGQLREAYGVEELWAAVHPDNVASIRICRRLGLTEQPVPLARALGSYDRGDVVLASGGSIR